MAYFTVCGTMKDDTENRRTVAAYLDPVREVVQPVDVGLFAGAMDYSKLPFVYRLIIDVNLRVGAQSYWADYAENPRKDGQFDWPATQTKTQVDTDDRLIVKAMKSPQGDFRDWDGIRDWAISVRPLLSGA